MIFAVRAGIILEGFWVSRRVVCHLTHLSRSCYIAAGRPSHLTSLFQPVLPEDLDKVVGNRRESARPLEV